MQYQLSRVVAGPLLRLLWRPRITGLEYIPPEGGAILASNHLSIVDSIFLPLMLDRPLTFAAKSEYFTGRSVGQRLAGTYLRATKQLSVDRAQARAAQDMLEAALALLRRGQLFGIYPEGTRSPDGRLYRGRTGVAWLALNSGLPVIPVAMMGTDRILPPGHVVPRLHQVSMRIGKPLTFEAYQGTAPGKARRAITDEVIQAIQDLSAQEYVPVYASDRKALEIVQLDLREMIGYTDYFVICTGRSERQTKAIHDGIHEGLKSAHHRLPRRVEGLPGARWILMDYLDVVVHVFTPETREYYRLEQLWGEAPAHAVGAGSA